MAPWHRHNSDISSFFQIIISLLVKLYEKRAEKGQRDGKSTTNDDMNHLAEDKRDIKH